MTEAELPGPQAGPVGGGTDLAITAISGDGSAVVRLSGELDLSTASRAEQALVEELGPGTRTLIVDLRQPRLLRRGRPPRLRPRPSPGPGGRGQVRLVHPNRLVRRVLEIAELGWLVDPGRTELPGARLPRVGEPLARREEPLRSPLGRPGRAAS